MYSGTPLSRTVMGQASCTGKVSTVQGVSVYRRLLRYIRSGLFELSLCGIASVHCLVVSVEWVPLYTVVMWTNITYRMAETVISFPVVKSWQHIVYFTEPVSTYCWWHRSCWVEHICNLRILIWLVVWGMYSSRCVNILRQSLGSAQLSIQVYLYTRPSLSPLCVSKFDIAWYPGARGRGKERLIPYSGKLSREKTFMNFADLMPFVRVFCTKIGEAHFGLLRIISGLWWIGKSFLCEILYFNDSWKFPAIRYILFAHVLN